jgi:hypothetical protein
LLIHAFFGGKLQNSKMVHCMDFLPLPLCLKDHFKWLWWRVWYCSRVITTCTMQILIFAKHLIFINQIKHGLARWLVKHIYTLTLTELKEVNHFSHFLDPNFSLTSNFSLIHNSIFFKEPCNFTSYTCCLALILCRSSVELVNSCKNQVVEVHEDDNGVSVLS